MSYPRSVWNDVPLHQLAEVLLLREALLDRLEKAAGHINAAERWLWREPDRGVWSARQAKARIAEVWMWLNEDRTDALLDVERYLDRQTTDERLSDFADAEKSADLESAWSDIDHAERAILNHPVSKQAHALWVDAEEAKLHSGVSRQGRYIATLRSCLTLVEDAFADRFLIVRQGSWLRLHDRALGCVSARRGLYIDVFMPENAWSDPKGPHRAYALRLARIQVLSEPSTETIGIPAYYWLCHAYAAHRAMWSSLKADQGRDVLAVAKALGAATDAVVKVLLSQFLPDHSIIHWNGDLRENVEALRKVAPSSLLNPLLGIWKLVETLIGADDSLRRDSHPSWPLQAAVAAKSLTPILTELGDLLQSQVVIPEGAQLIVSEAVVGKMLSRQGKRLLIRMPHGEEMTLSLFEDFVELCPRSME